MSEDEKLAFIAAYEDNAPTADSVTEILALRELKPLDETDERFLRRTVVLRSSPYLPAQEVDRFILHSVTDSPR